MKQHCNRQFITLTIALECKMGKKGDERWWPGKGGRTKDCHFPCFWPSGKICYSVCLAARPFWIATSWGMSIECTDDCCGRSRTLNIISVTNPALLYNNTTWERKAILRFFLMYLNLRSCLYTGVNIGMLKGARSVIAWSILWIAGQFLGNFRDSYKLCRADVQNDQTIYTHWVPRD